MGPGPLPDQGQEDEEKEKPDHAHKGRQGGAARNHVQVIFDIAEMQGRCVKNKSQDLRLFFCTKVTRGTAGGTAVDQCPAEEIKQDKARDQKRQGDPCGKKWPCWYSVQSEKEDGTEKDEEIVIHGPSQWAESVENICQKFLEHGCVFLNGPDLEHNSSLVISYSLYWPALVEATAELGFYVHCLQAPLENGLFPQWTRCVYSFILAISAGWLWRVFLLIMILNENAPFAK